MSVMNKKLTIEKISKENFNDFLYLVEKLAEYEKLNPPDEKAKKRLKNDSLSKSKKYEAYMTFQRTKKENNVRLPN